MFESLDALPSYLHNLKTGGDTGFFLIGRFRNCPVLLSGPRIGTTQHMLFTRPYMMPDMIGCLHTHEPAVHPYGLGFATSIDQHDLLSVFLGA